MVTDGMKLNKMKHKNMLTNILIGLAYLILIGLLVFNIFELPDKYNKEEMNMITEVENSIREALDTKDDERMKTHLSLARDEQVFDIVITRGDEIVYKTVPYEIGDSLLNRGHSDATARESQGHYDNYGDELFIWYQIYKLNDSVFITSFLKTLGFIVSLVTILLVITVGLISKRLFEPLNKLKRSIELANDYEFNKIDESEDAINKNFKSFVSTLESNISAVTREHTELEKQLQAKREHLNNIVVVSRSMVHDLKTPVHRNIIENEMKAKEFYDNEDLVALANLNEELNHNIMTDINRILNMLKNDTEKFELVKTNVNIVETLIRAVNTFSKSMRENGIVLDFNTPPEAYIMTEESTLILLINNLLSNLVLYGKKNSEAIVHIEEFKGYTSIKVSNKSSASNIERMRDTEKLFNTMKDPEDDGYIYRSGNGLYLIKELTRMLDGEYILETTDTEVCIEVRFNHET